MNRIDKVFADAKKAGRSVFVPFLTAGDPDLPTTIRVARAIEETATSLGVPMVLELGFPYSDPLADGPTIQSSYNRALTNGVRVQQIFDAVRTLRKTSEIPIVAMVSYTIVLRKQPEKFLADAKEAGFDGLIVPDLPVEESQAAYEWARGCDLKLIQLVAPTTRPDRLPTIARAATGFIYYMSVTGITGERTTLPADLTEKLAVLRSHAKVPICVGFGVSNPKQVEMLAPAAEGIIVGSALVRRVGEIPASGDLSAITGFVRELLTPIARG